MKPRTIYLSAYEVETLRVISRRSGKNYSDIIRKLIRKEAMRMKVIEAKRTNGQASDSR